MVREGVTWFSERGNPTADQTADVVAGAGPVPERSVVSKPLAASLETWIAPPTPSRSELWRAALRLWRRHPLLGVGPDNFRHLYSEVLAPQPDGRRFNDERLHANSLYFETLADLGLLGMVPLVLLIVALLQAARTHAARGQLVALACALSTGTFFVHGVLDTFLAFTPLYGLFWLLVALTHPGVQPETTASPDSRP
jgi:O-antigen ligase